MTREKTLSRRLLACLPLLPLLAACTQAPRNAEPTLADLAKRPAPEVPAGSAVDRELAIQGYRDFLKSAQDPNLRAEAMRRLADLTQEAQEEREARLLDEGEADGGVRVVSAVAAEAAAEPVTPESPPAPATGSNATATGAISPPASDPQAPEVTTDGLAKPNPLADAVARAEPVSLEEDPPESQGETERVVALYLSRLEAYPYHPQNDQVLYQLSRAYEYDAQPDAALTTLDRMVVEYPNSPLAAEAQFRRAELLFVRQEYERAEAAYRAVLGQGQRTGFYDQSLYKRGWSLFKLGEYLEGIDYFLALVDRRARDGRLDLEALTRAELEQIEDTLRAISLSFAYLDGPDTVAEYFRARGHRKDEDLLYRALGEEYLEKERYSDAATTFQAFVAAYPHSDLAPGFQLRAIEAFQEGGFPSQVLESRKAYVRLFDLRSPFWSGRDRADYEPVIEELKTSLKALASHFHALAQATGEDGNYALAFDWYQRYLHNFPQDAGAQELRFLLAELLFEHEDYAQAIEQYEYVAYRYSHNGRAADAGYGALQAYEKQAEDLDEAAELAWQQQALVSARRFAGEYPGHPKASAALLAVGKRLFTLGDGDGATAAARQLLTMAEAEAETRLSAHIIIGHSAFDAGEFLQAEGAYRDALASSAVDDSMRRDLGERLAASLYKQGEQSRAAGDLRAAADTFLRAAGAAPQSHVRATATFDAAAALIELEDWPRAAEVLETFRRDHPAHPRQPEVTRRLAVAYLESGRHTAAAEEFERLAKLPAPVQQQRLALWQAAELRQKAQQPEQERRVLQGFVARFPRPLEMAMEARQRLLELAEAESDVRAASRWREALIAADAEGGAERSERTRYLAASASLALADDRAEAYRELALVEPLQLSLKRKKRQLERALAAYADAAEYAVAEVNTAASFRIAELYADFGRALLRSERPASLGGEALEQYELLLEEEAMPFEEKAIEVHEANIRLAADGLYDRWIRLSYEQLAELVPARYAKAERSEDYVETVY